MMVGLFGEFGHPPDRLDSVEKRAELDRPM
jgi:hypothetical protein